MGVTAIPSDSNGVYSLPAGYLAITGETIQASQHNPPLEDLESAMSARLTRSGVAPMTGALKLADGAVGSPAVQFNSASSTGFYKTTNGIGVSVGGAKVAEFTASGISRLLGELIPYTGLTAQTGCVLPYGQTLSRATYADLWAFAQTEIAGGNTFYNNGNGTTTFGIGDLRGRVVAAMDTMGGVSADRLNPSITSGILGAAGGAQTNTLTASQMPVHYHAAAIYDPGHTHSSLASLLNVTGGTFFLNITNAGANPAYQAQAGIGLASTGVRVTSSNGIDTTYSAGGGAAHNNVQPTMICNYLLYVGA